MYLLDISLNSTNEKLLLQVGALMAWIKEALFLFSTDIEVSVLCKFSSKSSKEACSTHQEQGQLQ